MSRRRNPESGYALMLILAMAAILAITLYTEVPRAAFEAQRDKEQLLIDRGGEYQRAVTLFVRKFNRFPGSMEELENTNNQRFLRERFADPMTGKVEWRLIHAGPGGVLTDSVTTTKTDQKDKSTAQAFIADLGLTSSSSVNNSMSGEGANLATRRRPNDPGSGAGGDASGADAPQSNTGIPGYSGPVMVLPDGRIVPATPNGVYTPPGAAGASGRISPLPGMGLSPGAPGANPGLINPGLPPVMPSGVAVQGGPNMGAPPSSAAALINQILTSPRQPGGANGALGSAGAPGAAGAPGGQSPQGTTATLQPPQQQQQNAIGAGIAGVASKKEAEGIKTVNDRTKYNEWEFVYDVTKDPTRAGTGRGGATGATGATSNPNGANTPQQGMTPTMPMGPGRGGPGR